MDYKKGAYFGELAFLRNAPRAANVIAKTNCVCLTLDGRTFKKLLGSLEETLTQNAKNYESTSRI